VLVPHHHDKIRIVVATAPPKMPDQLAGVIERSFVPVWRYRPFGFGITDLQSGL
jgi:hypothetical protein